MIGSFTNGLTKQVVLIFHSDKLVLKLENNDYENYSEYEVPLRSNVEFSEPIKTAFNCDFLMSFIALYDKKVNITIASTGEGTKAIILEDECLLMPLILA